MTKIAIINVLAISLLAACADTSEPAGPSDDWGLAAEPEAQPATLVEIVEATVWEQWHELDNLPEISDQGDDCSHIQDLRVLVPTPEYFASFCQNPKAGACQLWLRDGTQYPAVLLNPARDEATYGQLMVQPMLEVLSYCRARADGSPVRDSSKAHLDSLIWKTRTSAGMSAEERVLERLAELEPLPAFER